MQVKLLLVLSIAASRSSAQTLEGTVVNSVTGAPVGGVAIRVETAGKTAYQTIADPSGGFRIDGVADGYYNATFTRKGFAADRRPFRLTSGSGTIRLQAQMTPLGKVSGRVLDGDGNPLPGAAVQLLQGMMTGNMDTCDSQGSFTFDDLAPGSYQLSAAAPASLKPPKSPTDQRMGWVRTYYPGVVERAAAEPIVMEPGTELWGRDIQLRAAAVHRLRGVVEDSRGDPAPQIRVKITPADEILPKPIEKISARDGSFEFTDLRSGSWRLSAEMGTGADRMLASGTASVASGDVEDFRLRLSAAFSVAVSIAIETADRNTPMPLAGATLFPSGGGDLILRGSTRDGKDFTIDGVYPGQYRISPVSPGPRFYLASITVGEREVLNQWLDFSPGMPPVRIVYKSDGGTVRGMVEDCSAATIALAPQADELRLPEFVWTGRCDPSGRFAIANIRPGDYYAFAFDRRETAPDLLGDLPKLIGRAVSVSVRRGETTVIDLKVTPR